MKKHFHFFLVAVLVTAPSSVFAQPNTFSIRADKYHETLSSDVTSSWYRFETTLHPRGKMPSEIVDTAFCPYQKFFCDASLSRYGRRHTDIRRSEEILEPVIETYISDLALRITRGPENAQFSVQNNVVIIKQESRDGRSLLKPESVAAIVTALRNNNSSVELPIEIAPASIRSEDRERLGLQESIGSGTTDFRGSPKNRIFNINRALEQFQDILIAPEETFSFVEHLGEVDGEHGYLPELVIKYNKTEPEFGGGICQVSSTLFRAAINAGLKIVERKNHAYPVQYYKPYGMDATIYIPKPDLRFVNNTSNAILIHPEIIGTKLTFSLYGTNDGRSVSIDGPHIVESNPDGSMKTTFSQKVTLADGSVLIDDNFPSNYKSPDLYPHFEIHTEKPKNWSKRQWEEYLVEKTDYEAKLRAAYATVVKPKETSTND